MITLTWLYTLAGAMFAAFAILSALDTGTFLELRREYAPAAITALGRVDGHPLGVIANDPAHLAGAIDNEAAITFARHLRLCERWGIPVLSLCDTPGFMVGPDAEAEGLVRSAGELFRMAGSLTVPTGTIVTRRGFGLGAQAMASGGFHEPRFTIAWPNSEFGPMGLEGAVKLGYRNELAAIDDPTDEVALVAALAAIWASASPATAAPAANEPAVPSTRAKARRSRKTG